MAETGRGNLLLSLAALAIVVAAFREARDLLLPLVGSMFLAALIGPAVFWLQERRISVGLSIPLLMACVLLAVSLLGGFIASSVNTFVGSLPRYQERTDVLVGSFASWLSSLGLGLSRADLSASIQPGQAMSWAGKTLTQVAGLLSDTLLVLFTTVLILFEATGLPAKIRHAFGDPNKDLSHLASVVQDIKNYVLLKTYTSLGTGLLVAGCLWLLGVDFPLLWGLLALLFNYVPNIGSIIAAVPPVLLALVQYGPGRALAALGAIVAVNMIVGNVIEPKIMGSSLGLSTLVVFLSLVFWGWVWGPVGMLLSVPLTMVVKIGLEHSERWRVVAVLLSDGSSEATSRARR